MPVATPERRTHCIRIEARDGTVLRVVIGYPVDLIMNNSEVYVGGIYATNTAISSTLSGAPTVIDIGSVYDMDGIERDEIQSGKWDGARVFSFFTDWANPVEDEEEDRVYIFGKVREEDDRFVVEMMSLTDLLSQSTGRTITPGCTYVLADMHVDGTVIASDKSRCNVSSLIVFESEISSVIDHVKFVAAGIGGLFPDDYFGFGEIIFTSGDNVGLTYKFIKSYLSNGTITLAQPFYYPLRTGDAFKIKAGCRKRFEEDCIGKFANGRHFGGYPHVPQKSTVQKFGDQ